MRILNAFVVLLVTFCAVAATVPARACALSAISGDCDEACSTIAPGWRHTLCILGATPPAADAPAR